MWVSFLFPICAFFQVTKLACHPFSLCPRVLLNILYISLAPLSIVDTRSCACRELMPYPWRCPASVVCLTTRNNKDIKSIFGADVHHVPELSLLGIGGAPYISHKIMAQKSNFHIFDFFSETTSRWCFILC